MKSGHQVVNNSVTWTPINNDSITWTHNSSIMIMALIPLEIPPGVYKNGTDFESSNRWLDC